MQKAEAQYSQTQNQLAVRQGKGAALESPQGERIAQLEAMVEASPQAGKLAQLAAMANESSAAAAQRRGMDMIHNSSHMVAQRKAADAIHNSSYAAVQRQQLDGLAEATAQCEEAEEPLQPKITQRAEAAAKPNNTGLPDNLKSGIESLSGMSMDNVKVHYNSSQPAQLNALAYAQGTDIHVAPGQEQHLPHEAWHVVQQAQGRVKPTMQMKEGVPVNDDKSLEHEADVMGAKALQMDRSELPLANTTVKSDSMQFFNLGWVPSNPGNYRGTTTVVGNTAATSGNADFDGRRYTVEANNIANGGGAGGMIPIPANNMISDVGGALLPNYQQAQDISPECDHIVPKAQFGANDLENARMVSKGQNTGGLIPRPNAPAYGGTVGGGGGDVRLRLYTPIASINNNTTGWNSGPIVSGTDLTFHQARALTRYAAAYWPASWANIGGLALGSIQGAAPGTQNGITVV